MKTIIIIIIIITNYTLQVKGVVKNAPAGY